MQPAYTIQLVFISDMLYISKNINQCPKTGSCCFCAGLPAAATAVQCLGVICSYSSRDLTVSNTYTSLQGWHPQEFCLPSRCGTCPPC
jgi:hypothetical protein